MRPLPGRFSDAVRVAVRTSAFLLALLPTLAQTAPEEIGQLYLSHTHTPVAAPESVIRDLRSSNQAVRLKALAVVGVPEAFREKEAYTSSGFPTGMTTVTPDQIELRYAALGSDDAQQAIIAVQSIDYGYVAIATPKSDGWELIALSGCWCKYDRTRLLDELVATVQAPEPGRFELVVRASGGGSGLYDQSEAHFRFFRGEMKTVLSFKSRHVDAHLHAAGHLPSGTDFRVRLRAVVRGVRRDAALDSPCHSLLAGADAS